MSGIIMSVNWEKNQFRLPGLSHHLSQKEVCLIRTMASAGQKVKGSSGILKVDFQSSINGES